MYFKVSQAWPFITHLSLKQEFETLIVTNTGIKLVMYMYIQ